MSRIDSYLKESIKVKQSLLGQSAQIGAIVSSLVEVIQNRGKIVSCGNGGSCCDAAHFTEELVARYDKERPGIPAIHLGDASAITCWANDYKFETVFSRQAESLLEPKDALVVFSTSGKSPNILRVLEVAKKKDALSIALLGKNGGQAKDLAQQSLIVQSKHTPHIQEAHIAVVHLICQEIEERLYFS